jgi:hypothetical protein
MIGDSDMDVQAGINAGCRTARILNHQGNAVVDSDIVGATLLETVEKVLSWRPDSPRWKNSLWLEIIA